MARQPSDLSPNPGRTGRSRVFFLVCTATKLVGYMENDPTQMGAESRNDHYESMSLTSFIDIIIHQYIPVVPHKAVAEVSKIGHYRRGELL